MELTDSPSGDIEFAIFSALEATIRHNVEAEIEAKKDAPLPFPKDVLVNKILQKNMDQLEAAVYITLGYDGKVYLAGDWLMRPVASGDRFIPMIEYLKQTVDTKNIVFCPQKSGAEIRNEIW